MKKIYLLFLLLAMTISFGGFAQTLKNDVIVKTDGSQIPCRMIAIGVDEVIYRNLNENNINRISKILVQKVLYVNGSIIVIPPRTSPSNPPSEPSQQSELNQVLRDIENYTSVVNRKVRLRIFFEVGSAKIQPQSFSYLDSIALFLAKIPTVIVEINGFTDNTGNPSSNLTLSQDRSDAVRDYLTKAMNVPATRIKSVGYGQTQPIAPNTTEAGRASNRRVELKFLVFSNDIYTLQFKNNQRLKVTFATSNADNTLLSYKENANSPLQKVPVSQVEFIEYPDGTRRQIGSMSIIAPPPYIPPAPQPALATQSRKKIAVQLNFLPVFMLGDKVYTSLYEGTKYGHTIGLGGSAQFDYLLSKWISVGAEVGCVTWRTQVNLVENKGEPAYGNYSTQMNQPFLLAHLGFKLGKHIYIMPQGGLNLLTIKDNRGAGEVFRSFQVSYGGTIGYLVALSPSVRLNTGLFYRNAMGNKTTQAPTGFESIQYLGFRLGLQF